MAEKILKFGRRLIQAVLIALLVLVIIYAAYTYRQHRTKLNYLENLDETAVTVDGEELTLRDLGFYVLFQEQRIEKEALIYNAESTKDFWNIHVNGIFIQSQAKKAAMEMAVHDHIFYRCATKEGIVLTSKEKQLLEDVRTDFWSDLFDEQKKHLPGTVESINATMHRIALAEKYQAKLAVKMDTTYAGLSWDGYDYKKLLKKEHEVKINHAIWDRVVFGDTTLRHKSVNYINGHPTKKEEAE